MAQAREQDVVSCGRLNEEQLREARDLAELCNRLGYPPNTKGALVAVVTRNGPAEQAGLRTGQVIVKVDKTPVTNAAAFQQAIAQADKDKGALLHVLRPSGEVDFAVLKLN